MQGNKDGLICICGMRPDELPDGMLTVVACDETHGPEHCPVHAQACTCTAEQLQAGQQQDGFLHGVDCTVHRSPGGMAWGNARGLGFRTVFALDGVGNGM